MATATPALVALAGSDGFITDSIGWERFHHPSVSRFRHATSLLQFPATALIFVSVLWIKAIYPPASGIVDPQTFTGT